MNCLRKIWNDDAGVIISAELVLILTIVVIGVIVGLVQIRDAVVIELHDLSRAFSSLNQSYGFSGMRGCLKWNGWGFTSWTAGTTFIDVYDGTNTIGVEDIGVYQSTVSVGQAIGIGNLSTTTFSAYGTIILKDGTLVPLTWVASGTWSAPGGILLAATTANSTTLRLADGTLIPFVLGRAGTIVLKDGTVIVVRPGLNGTLVLPDGTVATLDTTDLAIVVLTDGTRITFRPLSANLILLADGTTVEVKVGERSTLILSDGRIVDFHNAILPPGMQQAGPDCPNGAPCHSVPGLTPPAVQPIPTPDPQLSPEQPKKKPAKTKKTVMVS